MPTQPKPFTLTQQEAAHVQAIQSARQAKFARRGLPQIIATIAVPLIAVTTLYATDWFLYSGQMPSSVFVGLICAFLLGTLMQVITLMVSLADTKKRMLAETSQVWETRRVEIDGSVLRQTMDTSMSEFNWSSVGPVERNEDVLLLWFSKFQTIAIPTRAFASDSDATSFETEARRLAKANWEV